MYRFNIDKIRKELKPQHIEDVHRLDQQTMVRQIHNLPEGGYKSQVNQGYASCIEAYSLLHSHEIGSSAYGGLFKAADMLAQNARESEDYWPQLNSDGNLAATRYASEKAEELAREGETLIISGNRGHATIVRLSQGQDGNITCSTYNAGQEGWRAPEPNPQDLYIVERHQRLTSPQAVHDLIRNHALKSVAEHGSDEHSYYLDAIEKTLQPPHNQRLGNGQNWGNCTARSTREFITGYCTEMGRPELADGIRNLAAGGIEDNAYAPQMLMVELSSSLAALEQKSHGQLIHEVIAKNGGLPSGFGADGTRQQYADCHRVTMEGNNVKLEIRPPASHNVALRLESDLRGFLGDTNGTSPQVQRDGNTLIWNKELTAVAAHSLQNYIGDRSMESFRAQAFQQAYGTPGQPPRFDITWGNQGMTATDKQNGQTYSYSTERLDGILLERDPKPYVDRLITAGATIKQSAGRGIHMDAMDKVGMNGIQREIVKSMTQNGYLAEESWLGGKPRSLGFTQKDPKLGSYAQFRQSMEAKLPREVDAPNLAQAARMAPAVPRNAPAHDGRGR